MKKRNVFLLGLVLVLILVSGCIGGKENSIPAEEQQVQQTTEIQYGVTESRWLQETPEGTVIVRELKMESPVIRDSAFVINVTVTNMLAEPYLCAFENTHTRSLNYAVFWSPLDTPRRVSNGTYEVHVPRGRCNNDNGINVLICLIDEEGIREISLYEQPYPEVLIRAQKPLRVSTYIPC